MKFTYELRKLQEPLVSVLLHRIRSKTVFYFTLVSVIKIDYLFESSFPFIIN